MWGWWLDRYWSVFFPSLMDPATSTTPGEAPAPSQASSTEHHPSSSLHPSHQCTTHWPSQQQPTTYGRTTPGPGAALPQLPRLSRVSSNHSTYAHRSDFDLLMLLSEGKKKPSIFPKTLNSLFNSLFSLLWWPCRYFQMPGYNPYAYGQYTVPYMTYQQTPGQGGYPAAPPAGQPYPGYSPQPPQQQPYYPQQ